MNSTNRITPLPAFRLYALITMSAMLGLSLITSDLYTTDFIPLQVIFLVLCFFSLYLALYAFERGGYHGIIHGLDRCFTPIISKIILAVISLYFIVQASLCIYTQAEMIKLNILAQTPDDIIIITLALTSAFLFYTGLRQLAGTAQLLLFIIAPFIILLLIFGLVRCDFDEIRVVFDITQPKSIFGSLEASCALWGIEAILFFLGTKRYIGKTRTAVLTGFFTVFAVFILSFLITVGTFTLEGASGLMFPLSEMSRVINIGSMAMTERFDILFIFIQIIGTVIKTAIAMYCAAVGLGGMSGMKSHRCFSMLLLPAVVLGAAACSVFDLSELFTDICAIGFCAILFVITPIFAVITFITSKRSGHPNA